MTDLWMKASEGDKGITSSMFWRRPSYSFRSPSNLFNISSWLMPKASMVWDCLFLPEILVWRFCSIRMPSRTNWVLSSFLMYNARISSFLAISRLISSINVFDISLTLVHSRAASENFLVNFTFSCVSYFSFSRSSFICFYLYRNLSSYIFFCLVDMFFSVTSSTCSAQRILIKRENRPSFIMNSMRSTPTDKNFFFHLAIFRLALDKSLW